MAVPKKKISYSKTRKRLLGKGGNKLNSYTQCIRCSNFIKLHRVCPFCSNQGSSLQNVNSSSTTNIGNLYEINF
jgi:ribosomal protein L32